MPRDNPGREVILRVERDGQAMDLPVVPELAPTDNYGQIGVKLLANAEIRHRWVPSCKSRLSSDPVPCTIARDPCVAGVAMKIWQWMTAPLWMTGMRTARRRLSS